MMMKNIILFILSILGCVACSGQELIDDCTCVDGAKLPITIDWSKSGITPQNVTILFYDDSGGSLALEHNYEHNSKDIHSYVTLEVGSYTAVVFNELRDEIKNIKVRGHENLSTLGFYVDENTDIVERAEDYKYIHEPGMLGLKTINNIVVTPELISYAHDIKYKKALDDTKLAYEILLDINPENKINFLNILVHIKGLNNARMPALVDLQNISGGYMVAEDQSDLSPARLQFNMNNRVYDEGSSTEGAISKTVALFGVLGSRSSVEDQPLDAPIMLDVLFMLVDKDKTLVNHKVNITDMISFEGEETGSITLTVDVNIDSQLPDVEPEGSDSGFGSGMEDWNNIDIEL